ncbi:MAG TPA: RlpA-like double-psi beta-barrel domain-containing protein [Candidatus Limnocylindrales bacterium]|nr:RlpA-like double-psi beta-barrel domain-containing protein [Candidatus Limnocylindrales bacterium]
MRTRLIVAFAALMAASALVAVPEPAGSRPPSTVRSIAPATLTSVSISLPAGSSAMAIPYDDLATGSAERLGSASTFAEPGVRPAPAVRPTAAQPAARPGVLVKNYWRFDPDISWYGPGFYGNGTACGQKYSRTILGVAHRNLPCGTLVTFRNPANGRQITVPVIDRGPYVAGRTWDMSRALCEYLDHCYTGTIEWRWGGRRGG